LWNEKLKKWHFERKIKWSFPNKEDFYEYSTLFARVLLMSSLCLNVSKRYYKVLNVSKFKQSIKWVKNCYLFDTFLAETKLWQTISTSHFFERKLAKKDRNVASVWVWVRLQWMKKIWGRCKKLFCRWRWTNISWSVCPSQASLIFAANTEAYLSRATYDGWSTTLYRHTGW